MSVWAGLPRDRLLVDVSLWSSDLAALGDEVRRLQPHADLLHVDVADAHFAPGLLFFPALLAALRPLTPIPFHVHLMVERPLELIDDFIAAGADVVTVHHENGAQVPEAIRRIRAHGRAAGLAVGLELDPDAVLPYLDQVDLVLLMGTPLGIKGADLAPAACRRIEAMCRLRHMLGRDEAVRIGADGGIRRHTVPALRAAGADLVVPGSLVFGSPSLSQVFGWLRSIPGPAGLAGE